MASIPEQCRESAAQQGGSMCPTSHCNKSAVKGYTHALCNCLPPFTKFKIKGICINTPGTAIPTTNGDCFCCCSCFAYNTPIAYAHDEYKEIQDFEIGEMVYVADNPQLTSWSQKEVLFSSGAGGKNSRNQLLKVVFSSTDGGVNFLLCTRDQPFLLVDHKLKNANKLVPGFDKLLRADGSLATVLSLSLGFYDKGVHHIATSRGPATKMGGHLLVAKGVVVGDYALQVARISASTDDDKVIVDSFAELPQFGTKAYNEQYTHLDGNEHHVQVKEFEAILEKYLKSGKITLEDDSFQRLGIKGAVHIPTEVHHFVTKKQAVDLANAPAYPPASPTAHKMATYLFTKFQGFYPDVKFYIDEENLEPNAYSFIFADVPFVIINDGLLRIKSMRLELMAFIIAHELGHLYGDDPKAQNGYSCTGQADYAAISSVIPLVWFGLTAGPVSKAAIAQVKELFTYISPANQKGTPGDDCVDIPIDCRLQAMENALNTEPLPHCAGGPPNPAVALECASAKTKSGGSAIVSLDFNLKLDPSTVSAAGNYSFDPEANVLAAKPDPKDASKVQVIAELTPGTNYTLYVYGIQSEKHQPLISDKNSAEFTFK